jgi:hypothetical protein
MQKKFPREGAGPHSSQVEDQAVAAVPPGVGSIVYAQVYMLEEEDQHLPVYAWP